MAEPIGHALAEIQRTLDFTQEFDPSASTAALSIGLSDHPAFMYLPRLVATLREAAPGITLAVRNFTGRDDAVSMLDAGEVDMTIGVPPTPTGRILSVPLFEERFVCILRKEHPAVRQDLDLDTFLSLTHLLVSPENDRFGVVDAALAKQGVKRQLALTLPQLYAAPAIVASSDMIATILEGVVEASGQAERLHVASPPLELDPVSFTLSWHRRNDTHPAQRWFRDCISGLFAQDPARKSG
ncbi:LysR substrate-binding domain-containing protein [Halomonas sp. ML-15]|uniref:LysR substrate-binding domain-containing protein n=1 Tax=Halomonas sp. ML-15 TaxID=2773305 RepID=UPI001CD0F04A|nr:LysR substrate-binding domain-containing protein [Halomonas sp. ML-15]